MAFIRVTLKDGAVHTSDRLCVLRGGEGFVLGKEGYDPAITFTAAEVAGVELYGTWQELPGQAQPVAPLPVEAPPPNPEGSLGAALAPEESPPA